MMLGWRWHPSTDLHGLTPSVILQSCLSLKISPKRTPALQWPCPTGTASTAALPPLPIQAWRLRPGWSLWRSATSSLSPATNHPFSSLSEPNHQESAHQKVSEMLISHGKYFPSGAEPCCGKTALVIWKAEEVELVGSPPLS